MGSTHHRKVRVVQWDLELLLQYKQTSNLQRLSNSWSSKPAWRVKEGWSDQVAQPLARDEESLVMHQLDSHRGLEQASSSLLALSSHGTTLLVPSSSCQISTEPHSLGKGWPGPILTVGHQGGQHSSHHPPGTSGAGSPSPLARRHKMTKHQTGLRFANYNFGCSWAELWQMSKWLMLEHRSFVRREASPPPPLELFMYVFFVLAFQSSDSSTQTTWGTDNNEGCILTRQTELVSEWPLWGG